MALYNLKETDGTFRITKFTNDLEVESSYIVSEIACECPAGHRSTCRHRQMLPKMLAQDITNQPSFYDFESDQFFESELAVDDKDIAIQLDQGSYEIPEGDGSEEQDEVEAQREVVNEFFPLPYTEDEKQDLMELQSTLPKQATTVDYSSVHPLVRGRIRRRI